MNEKCRNCSSQNRDCSAKEGKSRSIKLEIPLSEISGSSQNKLEKKLNSLSGIQDAIMTEEDLLIFYDDIIVSPEKIKNKLN